MYNEWLEPDECGFTELGDEDCPDLTDDQEESDE